MSYSIPNGIPKLIHQTWRDHNVPRDNGDPDSWKAHNPDWIYKLWTDEDLLHLVETQFPAFLKIFNAYPNPVQRADLGRYCILKQFGGIYADVDTICHTSLEQLAGDARIILCEEPPENHTIALERGLNALYFNGTMASPAGHPFWDSVLELCRVMSLRAEADVLESTGPMILSAAVVQWPDQKQLALNSCQLFACRKSDGTLSRSNTFGPFGHLTLSTHLWQGSWFKVHKESKLTKLRGHLAEFCDRVFAGPQLNFEDVAATVDTNLLQTKIPTDLEPMITILIPVLNAEPFLEANLDQVLALNYPKHRLRIVYGQGESSDKTSEIIDGLILKHASAFASIESIKLHRNGPTLSRHSRWKAKNQYRRRSGLAKARNDLLAAALTQKTDWILWLDVDVIHFPADVLRQMLAVREKIVTPNCVLEASGPSYDLNAFLEVGQPTKLQYYRNIKNGLFQPPSNYWFRKHLSDLRYLNRVPLHGVGGTMLLVFSDVHRAGLNFPEIPYKYVLETEAFGYLARDLGVIPIGLPKVEIIHANS